MDRAFTFWKFILQNPRISYNLFSPWDFFYSYYLIFFSNFNLYWPDKKWIKALPYNQYVGLKFFLKLIIKALEQQVEITQSSKKDIALFAHWENRHIPLLLPLTNTHAWRCSLKKLYWTFLQNPAINLYFK